MIENTKLEDDPVYWKELYEVLYAEHQKLLVQLYNSRTQNDLYAHALERT